MKTCPDCGPFKGLGICPECGEDVRKKNTTTAAPDTRSEAEIQQDIKDYLHYKGYEYVDTSQPRATMISPGLSDLICFAPGRHCYAEIKRPGGKLSEYQERFRELCKEAGAVYEVWRSVEDARRWVEGEEAA